MIDLLAQLTKTLREIYPESYHDRNRKDPVSYPYLTFDLDTEPLDRNQEGVYLDIDLFDQNASYSGLFALEDKIKDNLIYRRDLTNDLSLIFSFLGSSKIPTADDNLKRRNLRFYIKIDWRNKKYGTS